MNKYPTDFRHSSTSCLGSSPETSPMDLAALEAHLRRCDGERSPIFRLMCAGEATGRFLAPRVVTILVVFTLVSVVAAALL